MVKHNSLCKYVNKIFLNFSKKNYPHLIRQIEKCAQHKKELLDYCELINDELVNIFIYKRFWSQTANLMIIKYQSSNYVFLKLKKKTFTTTTREGSGLRFSAL